MNISIFYTHKIFEPTKQHQRIVSRVHSRLFFEKICTQEKFRMTSKKVLIFGIKESLKIASKAFFSEKILNQDLHCHEIHKSFDLFINGGTYWDEIR